ncbi:MAG: hypothetical protein LBT81_04105 [Helicobacteraceae bacterium]|jgi:hypothetical protein|nr:hypothetical protein [Helicobacteraceae bacterium]
MRKIILLLCVGTFLFLSADDSIQPIPAEKIDIDDKIVQIKSVVNPPLPNFKNPFYYPPRLDENNQTIQVVSLEPKLESVIGKKAMISGEWKKKGELAISGWRVEAIMTDSVILKKDGRTRTLLLTSGVESKFLTKVGGAK